MVRVRLSTLGIKAQIKVGILNNGRPVIHLDEPYTDATYYEVDGEFYAIKYPRIFIRRR